MTYQFIKELVEKESGIKDLSIHDTSDIVSHTRLAYYKLATMIMPKWSHNEIRASLNRKCVSTIRVGIEKFDFLKRDGKLLSLDVYEKCHKELFQMYLDGRDIDNLEVEYETV